MRGEHTAQTDIVVVVELVDSLDLATNVQLLDRLVQVNDSGVLGVTTEDELALLGPIVRGKRIRQQPDPLKKARAAGGCPHCVRKSRQATADVNANDTANASQCRRGRRAI